MSVEDCGLKPSVDKEYASLLAELLHVNITCKQCIIRSRNCSKFDYNKQGV